MRTSLGLACVVIAACGGDGGDNPPADLDVIASAPASGDCTTDEVDGDYPFVVWDTEFGELDGRFDGALCFSN